MDTDKAIGGGRGRNTEQADAGADTDAAVERARHAGRGVGTRWNDCAA